MIKYSSSIHSFRFYYTLSFFLLSGFLSPSGFAQSLNQGSDTTKPGAKVPAASGHVPTIPGKVPTNSGNAPTIPGKVPTNSGYAPMNSGKVPTSAGNLPESNSATLIDSLPPKRKLEGPFILVLDAGHGGHDSGAKGRYSAEKNVALAITLKVAALVRNGSKDVKVILTRSTDEFIELNERARIANQNKANLFMCIHCNSVRNHRYSPEGAETYVLGISDVNRNLENAIRENSVITLEKNYQENYGGFDPNSPESYIIFSMKQNRNLRKSLRIANDIQAQFYKNNRVDRGVKQEPLLVLRNTTMPGILIETGYISSTEEEDYLTSEEGQNTLANSIYDAFIQYKNETYK